MRVPAKHRLTMFRRVRDHLRASQVPAAITPTLTQLEEVITKLEAHGTQQDLSSRRSRAGTESLRTRVRRLRTELLSPVTLVGRSIIASGDADATALRAAARMPRENDYEGLLAAANAVAKVLEDHLDAFTVAGVPKEHHARLVAEIAGLKDAIDTRGTEQAKRSAATAGAETQSRRGAQLVALISALYKPMIASDSARLAEWRTAMTLDRKAKGGDVASAEDGGGGVAGAATGEGGAAVEVGQAA